MTAKDVKKVWTVTKGQIVTYISDCNDCSGDKKCHYVRVETQVILLRKYASYYYPWCVMLA